MTAAKLPCTTRWEVCALVGAGHDASGAWLEPAKPAAAAKAAMYHYMAAAKAVHPCWIRGGSLSLRREVLCVVVVVYRDTACCYEGLQTPGPLLQYRLGICQGYYSYCLQSNVIGVCGFVH